MNLNCRMRNLGINNVLYWALDETAEAILRDYQIPVYYNPTFFSSKQEESYHTENYIKMMSERPKFWKMIMRTGFNMFFMDVDIAILKNPLDEIIGDADLEGQIDEFDLLTAENIHQIPQLCAGAFFLKSNERTIKFLDKMEKVLADRVEDVLDDQQALNHVLGSRKNARIINRFKITKSGREEPFGGYGMGYEDDRISARFIPIDTFMNGHIMEAFVNLDRSHGIMTLIDGVTKKTIREIDPALVHLNGVSWKERQMKKFNWWHVRDDLTCPLGDVS